VVRPVFLASLTLLASLALVATPAAAFDLDGYTAERTVDAWTVWCETEDDMGGTYYFDCVLVSATDPALVIAGLSGSPTVSRADGCAEGRVRFGATTLDLVTCAGGVCPVPGGLDDLAAGIDGGAAVATPSGETPVPAAGFGSALRTARDLLD
jgi:hypothetical protein